MNLELKKKLIRWVHFTSIVMALSLSGQLAYGQASSVGGVSSSSASASSASHPIKGSSAASSPESLSIPLRPAIGSSGPILVERGPQWDSAEKRWTGKDTLGVVGVVVALSALIFSAYTRWRTANQTYYAHLSKVWYDLRKEEAKNPGWMDPSETSMYGLTDPTHQRGHVPTAYDSHAWTCWALAEDVYETYGNSWRTPDFDDSGAKKGILRNELAQFLGAIRGVTELHWAWLQRAEHKVRFSEEFLNWIASGFLAPRVAEMKEGSVSGSGLMATTSIKSGQFLGFLTGEAKPARSQHTLQVGEKIHLLLDEPMRFLNHRATPLANAVVRGRCLFACSDISPQTEITIDYACSEDEFTFDEGGPTLGYSSLTKEERALRGNRLHAWILKRESGSTLPISVFDVPV